MVGSAGSAIGVVGKYLYVPRDDYAEHRRVEAVTSTKISESLDRINEILSRQQTSFERTSNDLQEVKVDIAIMKAQNRRGQR